MSIVDSNVVVGRHRACSRSTVVEIENAKYYALQRASARDGEPHALQQRLKFDCIRLCLGEAVAGLNYRLGQCSFIDK